VNKGTADTAGW